RERDDGLADVGIMLGDGLTGLDCDGVFDPLHARIADARAARFITLLNTYTEVSPSGRGVKALAFDDGMMPPWGRRRGAFEMYDSERFFTLTGNRVPSTPLSVEHRGPQLLAIHRELFGVTWQRAP